METRDNRSNIQATMSLRQKARYLSLRSRSTFAAIASLLVGIFLDRILSNSVSDSERACAAYSSSVISDSALVVGGDRVTGVRSPV